MSKRIIAAAGLLALVSANPAVGGGWAGQQPMTAEERVELYQQEAPQRRAQARAMAEDARSGKLTYASAKQVRDALQEDMEVWREVFHVAVQDWAAMRDHWLVDRKSLSLEQWAERRVAWFDARDAWMAANKGLAVSSGAQ